MTKLVEVIASTIDARERCKQSGKDEWFRRHTETLEDIERNVLPSGSGIDSGMDILYNMSSPDNVIIEIPFHHMDEHGGYVEWVTYVATVTPSLQFGFNVDIHFIGSPEYVGEWDTDMTMDYLADLLHDTLSQEYEEE